MKIARWIVPQILAVIAVEFPATSAPATPARSQSLLSHVAIPDETDIYFVPTAQSEYPTQVIGTIGSSGSSGSAGLIYNGRFGIGLFVNRSHIGRSRLSDSDDLTLTSQAIQKLVPNTDPYRAPTSTVPPVPGKLFDLFVSSPQVSTGARLGLGFSLSREEQSVQGTTLTLTDETGLPQSVSFDQELQSTLIAMVPGLSLERDRYRIEASVDIVPAFFRVENRLLGELPTTVSKEKLAEVEGVVLRQDGYPSIGAALRWQTRGGDPVNWTTWVAVDRRDLDSVNPATGEKINAFLSEINMQGGPQIRVAGDGIISVLAEIAIGGSDMSMTDGPLVRKRYTVLPGILAAAEKRIGKHVAVRGAFSNRTSWIAWTEPDPVDETVRRRQDLMSQSFRWAIGVSGHFGGLTLDADVEPEFLTHGPSLIGGDVSNGTGPGLFSTLSISYAFPRRGTRPEIEASALSM